MPARYTERLLATRGAVAWVRQGKCAGRVKDAVALPNLQFKSFLDVNPLISLNLSGAPNGFGSRERGCFTLKIFSEKSQEKATAAALTVGNLGNGLDPRPMQPSRQNRIAGGCLGQPPDSLGSLLQWAEKGKGVGEA